VQSRLCARRGESTESENVVLISGFVGFIFTNSLHSLIAIGVSNTSEYVMHIRDNSIYTYIRMALEFFVYVARELVTEFKVVNAATLTALQQRIMTGFKVEV
jgi:hypothetical protein